MVAYLSWCGVYRGILYRKEGFIILYSYLSISPDTHRSMNTHVLPRYFSFMHFRLFRNPYFLACGLACAIYSQWYSSKVNEQFNYIKYCVLNKCCPRQTYPFNMQQGNSQKRALQDFAGYWCSFNHLLDQIQLKISCKHCATTIFLINCDTLIGMQYLVCNVYL